ncbi:orotidine 5'-phosphate decarboxylase / HUMPS family protein [Furfurilactobacillus milii]|uniref:3-hexulose-6-phosphate synthase n=1 Tax=Furfurilactobacillus milii TaxID=2888272 RepID=A0A6N9I523_9LACO|nr:orotidine 5'-phosphate decarboxylase / HUMPS family protein [Furfurilactobacillus milii]MYV17536.1 3-hexulose-6-phosphate synthase [Furfurilactobacillus milii]
MKLQVAIDRKSLTETEQLVRSLNGIADIIEFGTSLIKDFGFNDVSKLAQLARHSRVLYDIKTVDEGAYEFHSGFYYGADYLTVMGSASPSTIALCYKETNAIQHMMIDLTDVPENQVAKIDTFDNAVYLVHHNNDLGTKIDAPKMLANFHQLHPKVKHIAVAGGIDLDNAQRLRKQGIAEIVIVGGKISSAMFAEGAARSFREILK